MYKMLVYLSVFSPNAGKYGPEKTLYLDSFHAVMLKNGRLHFKGKYRSVYITTNRYLIISMIPNDTVFEISNHFWAHENRHPNSDRLTKDIILILFNSR